MVALAEYDGFYGASRARQIAMGQSSGTNVVLTEINALQIAIDTAASGGTLEYITVGTTAMTNSTVVNTLTTTCTVGGVTTTTVVNVLSSDDYFNAWNDPYTYDTSVSRIARENMNYVINYFSRMGYSITRNRNGTDNYFNWKIKW
jgi:hypothetical protein